VISASNGTIKDFYREIRLPKNSEIHNIRNCFDESVGILRIEIPLTKKKNQNNSDLNNLDEKNKSSRDKRTVNDDKYLELVFDLHDYQFDKIDVQKNENNKNILIVKAFRLNNLDANIDDWSDINDKNSFFRKYVLPDWVSPKNIKIFEEKKLINGEKKNLLILNLPFI
jgi:HSP20 family molecular chaperone IbpA